MRTAGTGLHPFLLADLESRRVKERMMPTKAVQIENPPHIHPRTGRLPRISDAGTPVEDAVRLKEETDWDHKQAAKRAAAAEHQAALKIYSRAQLLHMRPPTAEDEEWARRALSPPLTAEEIDTAVTSALESKQSREPRAAKRKIDDRKRTIAMRKAAHPNWSARQICISLDEKMRGASTATKKAHSPLQSWIDKTGGKKLLWVELYDDPRTGGAVRRYISGIRPVTGSYG